MRQPVGKAVDIGSSPELPSEEAVLVLNIIDTAHALPGSVELFKYDCGILQHIASDSIVPIVELIELDGNLVVMSRDTGVVPLRDIFQRREVFSVQDVLAIASGVAQSLKDLHARNAAYKTLCPETIYASPDLRRVRLGPPLLPFPLQAESDVSPMFPYLSPEQRENAVYINQYRSDFYSLGIVLLEMLTGVAPAPTGGDVCVPQERIGNALRAVLERLLASDPEKRYQSAAGLQYDLAECSRLLSADEPFTAGLRDRSAHSAIRDSVYGGESELLFLRDTAMRVGSSGRAEAVIIAGGSGVGKTTLVQHALGGQTALADIITVELQPAGINADAVLERIEQELKARSFVIRETVFAGGSWEPDPAEERAIAEGASAAPASVPTALVIENLHFASHRFLQALAFVARCNAARPLMLLATADSSEPVPVEMLKEFMQNTVPMRAIAAVPLGLPSVRQMIVDIFGESLDDVLVLAELVMRKTEGNPRAVRTFLDDLVSTGILYFAFGRWQCDVHKLRRYQGLSAPVDVLSAMSSEIPYSVLNELFTAMAVDDLVDRVMVRELKKEIRSYRRQSRRNRDFVGEVQKFLVGIAGLMPELLFLFDIAQWKGVYANHDIRSMLGYTDTADNAVPPIMALLHPDDQPGIVAALERLRTAPDREVLNEEFRLKAADGSWQWFFVWITVFNRSADGDVQCIFGSARNITTRKEAQAALADSERRLSTIYNSVSDSILLVAMDGEGESVRYMIAMANQAFLRLSGMQREQLVGQDLRDVFGVQLFEPFAEHCAKAVEQRGAVHYEQEIVLARGPRIFDTTLTPVFEHSGACTHILVSGHDITRRIRAEERITAKYEENQQLIQKVNEQKSALMNTIVKTQEEERRKIALDLHEGLAQTLSIAKLNFSSFESQADALSNEQRRLLSTSVELLDSALRELSLISYNLMPNTLYDFGLIAALEDMFHMINRVSAVKLAFHTHDYRRLAHQTEIVLYRIIQELVNNAFRHSGASEISVQLIMHNRKLVVVVDDNGSGFDVNGIKNDSAGGIGLRSAEARVHSLDGSISVDSHANSGTVVAVEIPLVPASFASGQ